jgi:hypothetical protein
MAFDLGDQPAACGYRNVRGLEPHRSDAGEATRFNVYGAAYLQVKATNYADGTLNAFNNWPILTASATPSNRQPPGTWTMRWSVFSELLLSA